MRVSRSQRMSHYELRALLTGNAAQAALWVTSAAEYGLPAAQLRLGRMLLERCGVAKNQALALFWFNRAAEQVDAEAMNMVWRCCEQGWGCSPDTIAAMDWYGQSAHAGYFRGQYNYATLLAENGLMSEAADWFWQAASAGTIGIRRAIVKALARAQDPALRTVLVRVGSLLNNT